MRPRLIQSAEVNRSSCRPEQVRAVPAACLPHTPCRNSAPLVPAYNFLRLTKRDGAPSGLSAECFVITNSKSCQSTRWSASTRTPFFELDRAHRAVAHLGQRVGQLPIRPDVRSATSHLGQQTRLIIWICDKISATIFGHPGESHAEARRECSGWPGRAPERMFGVAGAKRSVPRGE